MTTSNSVGHVCCKHHRVCCNCILKSDWILRCMSVTFPWFFAYQTSIQWQFYWHACDKNLTTALIYYFITVSEVCWIWWRCKSSYQIRAVPFSCRWSSLPHRTTGTFLNFYSSLFSRIVFLILVVYITVRPICCVIFYIQWQSALKVTTRKRMSGMVSVFLILTFRFSTVPERLD